MLRTGSSDFDVRDLEGRRSRGEAGLSTRGSLRGRRLRRRRRPRRAGHDGGCRRLRSRVPTSGRRQAAMHYAKSAWKIKFSRLIGYFGGVGVVVVVDCVDVAALVVVMVLVAGLTAPT